MEAMLRRSLFRLIFFVAALGLAAGSIAAGAQQDTAKRGRKYKTPPPTASIAVTILRDANGKPIENAAVIFHPMKGEKDKGNMELKTNEDGKTVIDVLPIGDTVRLQVVAKGFQTYGEDYKVDKPELAIEIRMKRPGEQYSIYKSHAPQGEAGKSADADKTATPAKDATPPAGSAKPTDAQPTQPQP
jgi:5-hydroxyisourate hydrolase-like protein (transthyretin family)